MLWNQNDDLPLRRAVYCCVAVVTIIVGGTLGFWAVEPDWGIWKSLYFTLITVTTVGYGDQGISPQGEVLAAFLLVIGIAAFTYSLSTIIQIAVNYKAFRRLKMQKKIEQLADHVVVCGYGRMGKSICDELAHDGLACVVIEKNPVKYQQAFDHGQLVLQGIASDDDVLLKAGIERARAIVCAVDCDAENMFITVTARELNEGIFIASRAEVESTARKMERGGASLVVLPHAMAGSSIAHSIVNPYFAKVIERKRHGPMSIQLAEVSVDEGSSLAGQSIQNFGVSEPAIVFVAIERAACDTILRPTGQEVFCSGDVVLVAARAGDLVRMHKMAEPELATSV